MKNKLFLAWIILVLAAAACLCNGGNGATSEESNDNSIGSIQLVNEDVLQNNQPVVGTQSLLQNATIGVFNGGLGDLFFTGGLSLRLFNDSQVGGVSADPAPGSSLIARMRLEFGGFTGQLTQSGAQTKIETPSGASITVSGTDFFVVYEPGSQVTYCGNFGGSMAVEAAGSPPIGIPDGQIYRVDPGAPPVYWRDIPWSKADFTEIASANQSPMAPIEQAGSPAQGQDTTPPAIEILSVDPTEILTGPECPGQPGTVQITVAIFDQSPIRNASAVWVYNGASGSAPMERIDDQTFTIVLGPFQEPGELSVTIQAEDTLGFSAEAGPIGIKVVYCIG